MKIFLDPPVYQKILELASYTRDEFSGFGWCEVEDGNIFVYEFMPLNLGTFSYTSIKPEVQVALLNRPDASKMKVWLHRHPMGSGVPGPDNWSGTDNRTAEKEPFGSAPQLVQWSVSIVLTPGGLVGRIDKYLGAHGENVVTKHLEVEPNGRGAYAEYEALMPTKLTHEQKFGSQIIKSPVGGKLITDQDVRNYAYRQQPFAEYEFEEEEFSDEEEELEGLDEAGLILDQVFVDADDILIEIEAAKSSLDYLRKIVKKVGSLAKNITKAAQEREF